MQGDQGDRLSLPTPITETSFLAYMTLKKL